MAIAEPRVELAANILVRTRVRHSTTPDIGSTISLVFCGDIPIFREAIARGDELSCARVLFRAISFPDRMECHFRIDGRRTATLY
jgi:hypothetical protein